MIINKTEQSRMQERAKKMRKRLADEEVLHEYEWVQVCMSGDYKLKWVHLVSREIYIESPIMEAINQTTEIVTKMQLDLLKQLADGK